MGGGFAVFALLFHDGRETEVRVCGTRIDLHALTKQSNRVIGAANGSKGEGFVAVVGEELRVQGEGIGEMGEGGVGIPEGQLDSVFDPFVTHRAQGLGLGLTISRSIILAHRGRIQAENNADRGATFRCFLPVLNGQASADLASSHD